MVGTPEVQAMKRSDDRATIGAAVEKRIAEAFL